MKTNEKQNQQEKTTSILGAFFFGFIFE